MADEMKRRNEAIYAKYDAGYSFAAIAADYGITRQRIHQIVYATGRRRTGNWKAIPLVERRSMAVLRYIIAYKETHDGLSPSAREMRDNVHPRMHLGIIYHCLDYLEQQGKIKRLGNTRVMVVGGYWALADV